MKQRFVGVAVVCLAGLISACAAPEPTRPGQQYTIQDFLGTTSYSGRSFSPDNSKVLVSSDASGVFNAYAIPVKGGEPVRLTHSEDDSIFALGYFPADERFLYTQDEGGNELDHIYVHGTDGSTTDLTPGENLKASFLGWARDDATFYVGTNERDQRFFDVYEYQADGYEREMIYRNDQGLNFADISPDRRFIALGKIVTNADSDIYLYDRETEQLQRITEHEGSVIHSPRTFTPDGQGLLFLTDADNEFQYLVRHDVATGERTVVEQPDWDVMFAAFSKHGRYRVVGINADARTELKITDMESGAPLPLPAMDADITSVGFSRDESWMAFYASGARAPRDLFVLAVDGGEPVQLTRSLSANIDGDDLVEGRVVRFKSFDELEIPGVLYRPHQATEENKAPAVISVHGGPGGQSRIGYSALNQYLANHGYVVYAINNRGSTGYGKTFFHLDDRRHGSDDLDDCVSSKRMLIDTGYVDPDRIAILGGSYGGYMVLAALAFRPEEFAAGVDLFGISNWLRTVQNIPPWWESFRVALEQEMGAFDDEEFFRSKSPLFHAGNIVRPLMVLQGANDPRVLQAESDEIVAAARANGVPVEYVLFDDEGHGFEKKENREEGYEGILRFLDTHLQTGGEEPAAH